MKLPFKGRPARPKLKTPEDRMTLTDHLGELRMRLIRVILSVGIGFVVVLTFYEPVLSFLTHPYKAYCTSHVNRCGTGTLLIVTSPLSGFTTRISIASYAGILIAIPVILWQLWKFIVPGLHDNEKQYAIPFIVSAVGLFLLGAFVAYISLEPALSFLISWSGKGTTATFKVDDYMSFVGLMMGAFGVGLEFPLLLVFLMLVGVLKYQTLLKNWRYAIVGIVVIAAIITPSGDPFSLFALATPMLILYFVAALIGMRIQKRRARETAEKESVSV